MLSCHSPCRPTKVSPAAASSATFQLPNAHARYAATATTPSQPITGTGRPYDGCAITAWNRTTSWSTAIRIASRKALPRAEEVTVLGQPAVQPGGLLTAQA